MSETSNDGAMLTATTLPASGDPLESLARAGPDQAALEGARLGHYVLLDKLGQGGMGVVFAAFDTKLDRKVAIKLLHAPDDEAGRLRMIREAQAMARVSHPNVVQVFEIAEQQRLTFLVMEFIEGRTLSTWFAERERSRQEILATMIAAGRGLAAAHQRGLVHRDFKPDNVMIRRDGRVVVMDFGLAHAQRGGAAEPDPHAARAAPTSSLDLELTGAGALIGTPRYMAAEQFLGRPTDARTDQFSFCVTLWQALFGQLPFRGSSLAALSAAVLANELDTPRHADVPVWLRRVLERGLAAEPALRWPTMNELLAALERDPSRRRRALALGLGLVVLTGALAGGAGAWREHQRRTTLAACEAVGEAITDDWNDEVANALALAFAATEVKHARSAWTHTRPWLDDYAREWTALRTQTCVETRLEHTRDASSHDSIIACLDNRRTTFAGLLAAWADADARTVTSATVAASSLPALSNCTDPLLAEHADPPPSIERDVALVRTQLDHVEALRLAGDYDEALVSASQLRGRADALGWRPLQAELALALGNLEAALGRYEAAHDIRVRAYLHALAGADDHRMLDAAIALTHNSGYQLAQIDEGRQWGAVGEMLIERLNLHGTSSEATLLAALGGVETSAGNYAEALEHFRRAMAGQAAALGPNHPSLARLLDSIGVVLFNQREFADATDSFRRSLALQEATLGSDHPALAYSLNNLGAMLSLEGKAAEALALQQRALDIQTNALGPMHPDVAASLSNLGTTLAGLGDHEGALEHQARSLQIFAATVGDQHPDTATTHAAMGEILSMQGRYEEALASHRRALAIRELALGPEHPEVGTSCWDIGLTLLELGQVELALDSLMRALAIREATLGPEHIEVATALVAIARARRAVADAAGAREALQRAIEIAEREGHTKLLEQARSQLGESPITAGEPD